MLSVLRPAFLLWVAATRAAFAMYNPQSTMHEDYRAIKGRHFYKHLSGLNTPTFAIWILQGVYDSTDNEKAIAGNCRSFIT